jgi:phosphate:Na+ symporter
VTDPGLNHFDLWTGLFGGLALFLFGMDLMTKALKRAAGDRMKDLLGSMTRNRLVGVGMGAFVTGIVNSSSVTTVILVGFISAGLMSMAQSVSVIMGANIGSTVTAQILAFKVTRFALPMITIGFLLSFLAKREDVEEYGRILLGMGLVFFGMGVMSDAMAPLRSYEPFINFMSTVSNPFTGALVGALFTAVIQSSAATTGIVIVLAGQGLIGLETAIAIALGANIGTCATAGLAVIGKPREAVRAALVLVLFNVAGVAIWIGLIGELAEIARTISPTGGVEGTAPRQVANAHTIFNVLNTLIFISFTPQIARLVEWLVPDRPLSKEEPLPVKFLDDNLLDTPAVALQNARYEIVRLGEYVGMMLDHALPTALGDSRKALADLADLDKPVDRLHRQIIAYLGQISLTSLSPEQARLLMRLVEIANDLEHIADRIAADVVTSARKRLDEHVSLDQHAVERVTSLHSEVSRALAGAIASVKAKDAEQAAKIRSMKHEVVQITHEIEAAGFQPRPSHAETWVRSYIREAELLEILDGVFKIARRIARTEIAQESDQEEDEQTS